MKTLQEENPFQSYLSMEGRFKDVTEKEIKEIEEGINEKWEMLKKFE